MTLLNIGLHSLNPCPDRDQASSARVGRSPRTVWRHRETRSGWGRVRDPWAGRWASSFFPHQAPPFPCACACNTGARSQICRGAASQPPIVAQTSAQSQPTLYLSANARRDCPLPDARRLTLPQPTTPRASNSSLSFQIRCLLVRQPAAGNPARKGCVALALFARTQTRPASGPPLRTHPALRGAAGKTTNQANIGVPRIITIWTRAGGSLLAVVKHNYGCLLDPPASPRASSPSLTEFPTRRPNVLLVPVENLAEQETALPGPWMT